MRFALAINNVRTRVRAKTWCILYTFIAAYKAVRASIIWQDYKRISKLHNTA